MNSEPETDGAPPQPPPTIGDRYLLPEYASAFINFVDDTQWHLVMEYSPLVKDAFTGEARYAIPATFGQSISTAGSSNGTSMHIETSAVESAFTLTRDMVLSGNYTAFTDNIAENLPRILEAVVPAITQSMVDQGALVKLDHTMNFWDQLLDWIEKSNLNFGDDGSVSFDHLKIFGQGDVGWINNVRPSTEQIERWQNIIDRKRAEYLANQNQRRFSSGVRSDDQRQIHKIIGQILAQEHDSFLKQYRIPEYETAQVGWFHGLAQFEIMQSPTLAAYHQKYVELGLHEASSTGPADGTTAFVPQKNLVLQEVVPLADVLAGNYNKRHANIRSQVDAIRRELVQESVPAIEALETARGPEAGIGVIKGFNWEIYLDRLEEMAISFDVTGKPILPVVHSGDPEPPPRTEAQNIRLESIIIEKRKENHARRTSHRRLSE